MNIKLIKGLPLHLGNGDHSAAEVYALIQKLQLAFSLMFGRQQGAKLEDDHTYQIVQTASDILKALTGYRLSTHDMANIISEGAQP